MRTMVRRAILAGAAVGMTALTITAPAVAGAAFATPSPTPTGSQSTPPSPPPPHAPHLDVTITPGTTQPGTTVNIKAVVSHGVIPAHASAQSPVLDAATLTTSGSVATGTGHVRSDAKAGVYSVLVQAMAPDSLKLRGTAQLTVVVTTGTPTPTPTPTVPRGGVGTGGGGAAGGVDLALIGAGSAIALLGVTAAVTAMRRRRNDVRH